MSKKLAYPRRDADGKVIEPNTLTVPAWEVIAKVLSRPEVKECSRCHETREQNIVDGMCDECARKRDKGMGLKEIVKDGAQ